jgi:hypothetical protein
VFDVKLQGETVLADFDIAGVTEGRRLPVTREFRNVPVGRQLALELVSKGEELTDKTAPIICGLEVYREQAER